MMNVNYFISIHAPRVGSDGKRSCGKPMKRGFQSTLPAWGATHYDYDPITNYDHFNPRSPRGERHGGIMDIVEFYAISIHAPRVGSDARVV